MIAFVPDQFGTPNPPWTKRKVRGQADMRRLADHICTRTPPRSYGTFTALWLEVVRRNKRAIGGWSGGYGLLARMVAERLIARDGTL